MSLQSTAGSNVTAVLGLPFAAACLPAGFGVAVATGIRPLGGIVLIALAWAAGRLSGAPARRQARWYLIVFLCFVVSHLLGLAIGAWPAVAVVTVVATTAYVSPICRSDRPVSRVQRDAHAQ